LQGEAGIAGDHKQDEDQNAGKKNAQLISPARDSARGTVSTRCGISSKMNEGQEGSRLQTSAGDGFCAANGRGPGVNIGSAVPRDDIDPLKAILASEKRWQQFYFHR
jgi:hypothetical protein